MNLADIYMEKFIWMHVTKMGFYRKTAPSRMPAQTFFSKLGAPELVSADKRYRVSIYFKSSIPIDTIDKYFHTEYDIIKFQCGNKMILIEEGAILYKRIDKVTGQLVVEINAVYVNANEVNDESYTEIS